MRLDVLLKPQVLVATLLVSVLTIFGLHTMIKKIRNKPQLPYTIEKPSRRDLVQYISAAGTVKAKDQISIGSLVAGKVEKLLVEDNDKVKKNQVLAVLDNGIGKNGVDLAAAQLEQAKAQLKYQKRYMERQTELFEAGELAQNTYDQLMLQYEQALGKVHELEANLAIEQRRYNDLFIRSPEDGVVTARRIDLGQMVTSQLDAKVLFEVVKDLTDMEVWADIDEADVGLVKDGQDARFFVDTFPNKIFRSKVKLIQYNAKLVDSSITYAAVLSAPNPELQLRPGMTANVDIKVADRQKVLCVPYSAQRVNSLQVKEYALKNNIPYQPLTTSKGHHQKRADNLWVMEDGAFKQRHVTFGARDGSFVEVVEGISENDNVIVRFLLVGDNTSAIKNLMGKGGLGSGK